MIEHVIDGCHCEGKRCRNCEETKCIKSFQRRSRSKDGRDIDCAICRNAYKKTLYNPEYTKQYRETHREYLNNLNKQWRENNAEYNKQRMLDYREANLEQVRERDRLRQRERRKTEHYQEVKKAYEQKNAEELRAKRKIAYQANRERHSASYKAWRERNAEYDKIRHDLHRAKHPEQHKTSYRNWCKDHREQRSASQAKRRAKKRSIPGTYTAQQVLEKLKKQHHRCYYCTSKFKRVKNKYIYHVDHTFPISRVAGTDIPANSIDYLVLTCPRCNLSKGDRYPHEWPEGGKLL